MDAVWLTFRSGLRRRWRAWAGLGLLVALVGGIVTAAVAAGFRTEQAFPQFLATTGAPDVELSYAPGQGYPVPTAGAIRALPGVTSDYRAVALFGDGTIGGRALPPFDPIATAVLDPGLGAMGNRIRLVSGRLPAAGSTGEAVVSFATAQHFGAAVGTVIHYRFFSLDQLEQLNSAPPGPLPVPSGVSATFRVVGVIATAGMFPDGASSVGGTDGNYVILPSAFLPVIGISGAPEVDFVRLRSGPAGIPAFTAAVDSLVGIPPGSAAAQSLYPVNLAAGDQAVERSIHLQAVAWWIFAGLVAVAGLAVVGQSLLRQHAADSAADARLRALGMSSRQLMQLALFRALVVAAAAVIGTVILAIALSPASPVGEARLAEVHPGVTIDLPVLALGALAVAVAVLAIGAAATARTTRRRLGSFGVTAAAERRPSLLSRQLARAGASPSMLVGVANAVGRGAGTSAIPVGTALLATVVALIAVTGSVIFGVSLHHLIGTPRLYGDNYAIGVVSSGEDVAPYVEPVLTGIQGVTAVSGGTLSQVAVDGRKTNVLAVDAVKGPMSLSVIQGRAPAGDREIALGTKTMDELRVHLGSTVSVDAGGGARLFRVVGRVTLPLFPDATGEGSGAAMTFDALAAGACPPGAPLATCAPVQDTFFIGVAPGPAGAAAAATVSRDLGNDLSLPQEPIDLFNFGQALNLPLLLGLVVAIFGAATLAHLLLVSLNRRRTELAVLKSLGFVRGQVSGAVVWQAATVAVVAAVVGIPLGTAAGRVAWQLFASQAGVVPSTIVPLPAVGLIAAGSIAVALLVALLPAWLAARTVAPAALRAL